MNNLHILTDEQLVKMAQEGSETAEELLIEKYKSLAKNKAKAYYIAGADNEDVVQEGMIGLYKAIRDYRPDKQTSFLAFAELCVTHRFGYLNMRRRPEPSYRPSNWKEIILW